MIRKLQWHIAWWFNMEILKRQHVIIAYPVIAELSLNQEKYKEQFMKGQKLRHIVFELVKTHTASLAKNMRMSMLRQKRSERRATKNQKDRIAFIARYERFCNYYKAKIEAEEIDRMMKAAEEDFEKLEREQKN